LLASAFQLASIPSSISATHGALHAPLELHQLVAKLKLIYFLRTRIVYLKTVVSLFKDTDFLERGFPNKTVVGEVGGTSGLLLMQL